MARWGSSGSIGKARLTVRERIELLTDPGSFDEMGKLQGRATYDEHGELKAFIPVSSVRGLAKVNGPARLRQRAGTSPFVVARPAPTTAASTSDMGTPAPPSCACRR